MRTPAVQVHHLERGIYLTGTNARTRKNGSDVLAKPFLLTEQITVIRRDVVTGRSETF